MPWGAADREERRHKKTGSDQRTEFERDRDRILYSSAFQRLAGITQIVRAGEADIFHTRQQHTVKVAQIGRRLAQSVVASQETEAAHHGIDPEVVEAACLAHDLGHPPFGHIGEKALHTLVQKNGDTDGFEGNAQSFRILTKLAVRFPDNDGMDLTRATLAASLKYPWFREHTGTKSKKWAAYRSETEDFNFARQFHPGDQKTAEAELMDWSDDVAYSVHDLEDFHRCNAIPWASVFGTSDLIVQHVIAASGDKTKAFETRIKKAYGRLHKHIWGTYSSLLTQPYDGGREQREQLRRMTSQLIGKYIRSIELSPIGSPGRTVTFDEDAVDEVRILKQITRDYIIASPTLAAQQHGQRRIIEDLFDDLYKACEKKDYPDFLPVRLRYLRPIAGSSTARFVSDCIAGLSEREAIGLHGRLRGTATGSVLDPIVR